MTDIVSAETRSRMMSGIRARNTKPELVLRRALHARGFRYRLHVGNLPGKPDLVFPKYRAAVQVHGCFWHRHGCAKTSTPSSNIEFWDEKFRRNVERDAEVEAKLEGLGWRLGVVWECGVGKTLDATLVDGVARFLTDIAIKRFEWPQL